MPPISESFVQQLADAALTYVADQTEESLRAKVSEARQQRSIYELLQSVADRAQALLDEKFINKIRDLRFDGQFLSGFVVALTKAAARFSVEWATGEGGIAANIASVESLLQSKQAQQVLLMVLRHPSLYLEDDKTLARLIESIPWNSPDQDYVQHARISFLRYVLEEVWRLPELQKGTIPVGTVAVKEGNSWLENSQDNRHPTVAESKILVAAYSGHLTNLFLKCFETARFHSPDCRIELFTDFTEEEKARLRPLGVTFHPLRTEEFLVKEQGIKVEVLRYLDCREGDQIIVSDLDLVFQADPFKVFEDDFDVFFTTRHYHYHYVINSGIFGFRVNERSRRFVKFWTRQMYVRDWRALREYRSRFGRAVYGFDFMDQDMLCTVYENLTDLPVEIRGIHFYDAGYRYNFCPTYDIYGQAAVGELKSKIGNPDYVVLHLKAELKHAMDFSILDHGL